MAKKAYIGVDGKARKIKKGYIGVENFVPRALPEGYTQLSHIEATGAQYFDTGFVPNSNTKAVVDYSSTATAGTVIGSDNSWLSNDFVIEVHFAAFATTSYNHTSVPSGRHTAALDKGEFVFDGETLTTMSGSFTGTYPLTLFALNRANSMCEYGTLELYSCQIYDNGKLVRDYVPCKNSSGTVGLYDMVNNTFGGSATSTAFVEGSSVQSVARKIKKAYIGIGGVARPCWSGGELAYYGTIDPLSIARYELAATSVGNYALFAGGSNGANQKIVDSYNSNLTRSSATALSTARSALAATSIGDYALFGGGKSTSVLSTVETYDKSLTKKLTDSPLGDAVQYNAATSVGNYAVFAGGCTTNQTSRGSVTAYSTSLAVKPSISSLTVARHFLAATNVGDYAIFGGGSSGSTVKNTVDAYNTSLARSMPTALSVARRQLAATTVGDYALFGGGYTGNAPVNTVDIYNSSLTRTTSSLSVARYNFAATTVGKYAIFGGGSGYSLNAVVDAFDTSLTRTNPNNLASAVSALAATTVGNYALFGGGLNNAATDIVNAYTVA